MNSNHIQSSFARMGARLTVREIKQPYRQEVPFRWHFNKPPEVGYAIDIQRDRDGQFFELRAPDLLWKSLDAIVVQAQPKQRHLLLVVRVPGGPKPWDRFLCG